MTVNGDTCGNVSYPVTPDWHQYYWTSFTCSLNKGKNSIELGFNTGYAEVDCIALYKSGYDLSNNFMMRNRNSGKYVEVAAMSAVDGVALTQYDKTFYPCQVWSISETNDGSFQLINKNSGLAAGIASDSAGDGAAVIQSMLTDENLQKWTLLSTDSGYYQIINKASEKLMEVTSNLTSNGAQIGQWGVTSYSCQEWALEKEAIQ